MDYEKKLALAKEALDSGSYDKETIEYIFPELAESEDERIRKALICGMYALKEQHKTCFASIPIDNAIAWLEKQGEQKPIDKVEPKFNVGDWILYSGDHYEGVRHITKIDENGYYIERNGLPHGIIPFNHEICMRLWTIQDAKDGDVLNSPSHHLIWIYKDIQHYHVCVNMNYVKKNLSTDGFIVIPTDVCPATKDEQTILFARMKEAGYEWDAEKKELKKIEQKPTDDDMKTLLRTEYEKGRADAIAEIQNPVDCIDCTNSKGCINCKDGNMKETLVRKPAWSEEDEDYYDAIIAKLEVTQDDAALTDNQMNFLKSLKNRVLLQLKQEWGEEDERMLQGIIDDVKQHKLLNEYQLGWLFELSPQNKWKPSDKQMKALRGLNLIGNISYAGQGQVLIELYNDLKKLKGD